MSGLLHRNDELIRGRGRRVAVMVDGPLSLLRSLQSTKRIKTNTTTKAGGAQVSKAAANLPLPPPSHPPKWNKGHSAPTRAANPAARCPRRRQPTSGRAARRTSRAMALTRARHPDESSSRLIWCISLRRHVEHTTTTTTPKRGDRGGEKKNKGGPGGTGPDGRQGQGDLSTKPAVRMTQRVHQNRSPAPSRRCSRTDRSRPPNPHCPQRTQQAQPPSARPPTPQKASVRPRRRHGRDPPPHLPVRLARRVEALQKHVGRPLRPALPPRRHRRRRRIRHEV